MKRLTPKFLLQCATIGEGVIDTLDKLDQKMTYPQFAEAVGLKATDEKWEVWHRQQVSKVCYLVGAVRRDLGQPFPEPFDRLIAASTGKPGPGARRVSRIVVDAQSG